MPFTTHRRLRPVKYTQRCQHCHKEITTRRTYFNYWYSLLCSGCFKGNVYPVGAVQVAMVYQSVEG